MHSVRIAAACAMLFGSTALAADPNSDITKERFISVVALHTPHEGNSMCWITTSTVYSGGGGTNWNGTSISNGITISPGATVLVADGKGENVQKLASYVGVDDYKKCIRT